MSKSGGGGGGGGGAVPPPPFFYTTDTVDNCTVELEEKKDSIKPSVGREYRTPDRNHTF